MTSSLRILALLCITCLLMSASADKSPSLKDTSNVVLIKVPPSENLTSNTFKTNFFQRLLLRLSSTRIKQNVEAPRADKEANASLALGLLTTLLVIIPMAIQTAPILFLFSIPTGIAAIVLGNNALRRGTSKTGRARLGRGLGWGILISLALLTIIAAIAVASSDWW